MTDADPPPPAEQTPALPPPLEYRSGASDRKARRWSPVGYFVVGLTVSLVISGACFFVLLLGSAPAAGASRTITGKGAACCTVVAVTLIAMLVITFREARRRQRMSLFAGVLLGVALAALPLGACFAIIGSGGFRLD